MEGYIHSFESFGTSDGPGIRFVVFLQGCPMRCLYCHNPDTREFTDGGKRLGTVYAPRQVLDEILKYEKYIASGGVTVSGGEPMAQAEFVTELFSLLKERGIHTALDTSGCAFDAADEAKTKTIGADFTGYQAYRKCGAQSFNGARQRKYSGVRPFCGGAGQ